MNFQCPECYKEYEDSNGLRRHIAIEHPDTDLLSQKRTTGKFQKNLADKWKRHNEQVMQE